MCKTQMYNMNSVERNMSHLLHFFLHFIKYVNEVEDKLSHMSIF